MSRQNGNVRRRRWLSLLGGAALTWATTAQGQFPVRPPVSGVPAPTPELQPPATRVPAVTPTPRTQIQPPLPTEPSTTNPQPDSPAIIESEKKEVKSYSLPEVETLAQEISPNLRESAAAVDQARGLAVQAGLYPNPIVSFGSPQWAGKISQYYTLLSQEVVTAHKLRLNRSAALRQVDQAEYNFVRTRFELLTAVRSDFYSALAAQRRVQILNGLVEIARKSLDSANRLKAGGEGTRADVLLLEIEFNKADVALTNAKLLLSASKRQLAAAIGDPTLQIGEIVAEIKEKTPSYEYESLRDELLRINANVGYAQVEIERNRILLRRARVEPIPNIFLQGGYQYQVPEPYRDQGVFQISVPIPVFNRNQGNIQANRAAIAKATEGYQRVQNELSNQLADILGQYLQSRQLVARYESEILPAALQTYELAQRGYLRGEFDFLRLLAAQKTRVETELGYITAQENRWTTASSIAGLIQKEQFPPPSLETQEPITPKAPESQLPKADPQETPLNKPMTRVPSAGDSKPVEKSLAGNDQAKSLGVSLAPAQPPKVEPAPNYKKTVRKTGFARFLR